MRIEVGKTYKTRMSLKVKIVMRTGIADRDHDMMRPYLGDNGVRYRDNGDANAWRIEGQTLDDLIEEAVELPSTEQVVGELVMSLGRAVFSRFL